MFLVFRARLERDLWIHNKRLGPPPTGLARRALRTALEDKSAVTSILRLAYIVAALCIEDEAGYEEAIAIVREAVSVLPMECFLQTMLGRLLWFADQTAEARQVLSAAYDFDKQHWLPSFLLGQIELAEGHAASAVIWLQRAVELVPAGPRRGSILNDLGVAQARAGQVEASLESFDAAIRLLSDDFRPVANRALAVSLSVQNAVRQEVEFVKLFSSELLTHWVNDSAEQDIVSQQAA